MKKHIEDYGVGTQTIEVVKLYRVYVADRNSRRELVTRKQPILTTTDESAAKVGLAAIDKSQHPSLRVFDAIRFSDGAIFVVNSSRSL